MFKIDSFDNLEPLQIYLAEPDGRLLYLLNYSIDEDSASLSPTLNGQYELTFDINSKYFDNVSGELKDTPGYDKVLEGMYLVVENVGLFRMIEPEYNSDGIKETKTITAYGCDCELENALLDDIKINQGSEDSQEYLVEYEDGETEELVNDYTNIPYDWILFYNTLPQQCREWKTKYNNGYFGTPNSKITVTDSNLIDELDQMCKLSQRLQYRITRNDAGNITGRIDYVTYNYNDDNTVISSIVLDSSFGKRIDELITYYDKYHKQLSLLDIILEKMETNWSIGEVCGLSDGDYTLCNKKMQFEIDENIYSFLTQTLAQICECVVQFDIINRKINITPVEKLGKNTGIIISYDNLLNNNNITCDETNLSTRLYVTGADDLSIRFANIGQAYIEDLTYKINARDNDGKRIYVTDELADKYDKYITYFKSQREPYMDLTRQWNQYDIDIDELTYRVPVDAVKTNWGTFKKEELDEAYTSYTNQLYALISMYRTEYGAKGENADGSVNETFMQTTPYWYDYKGFKYALTEIQCAIDTYPFYSNKSKWSDSQKATWEDEISAWETDWKLYGINELQTKISSYEDKMRSLVESKLVFRTSDAADSIKSWSELTDAEKKETGNIELTYNSSYDLYMENLNNYNSATVYLSGLKSQLSELESQRDAIQEKRLVIVNSTKKKNYFTQKELNVLSLLYKDAKYSNENILITSLDDSVSTVDVQKELLEDGEEKLSMLSRPQFTFSAEMENLLGLPDFKMMWDDFQLGNYILVELRDGTYIKQRLTKYTFNPLIPNSKNLDVEFSNYITYSSKIIDTAYLLDIAATDITTYGSGSKYGGGSGDFEDEITNSMLKKLLESETFGTRVKNIALDTMTLNELTAKKAIFGGFETGQTVINGEWIKTGWITDAKYNGDSTIGSITNTKGSIINLETGQFNLADGNLIWDGSILHMIGTLSWDNVIDKDEVATKDDVSDAIDNLENSVNNELKSYITKTYYDTETGKLNEKIDGKIETFRQSTDPSTYWKDDATKKSHIGDLWYNTSTKEAKIYNGSGWDEFTSDIPDDILDEIDGKAQIFLDTPKPPYDLADLWFTEDGEIKVCKTPKTQGQSFDDADWVEKVKYTDDSALIDMEDKIGYTKIDDQWVIAPNIRGGTLEIGTANNTYAKISTDGKITARGVDISGAITATSLTLGSGVKIGTSNINGLATVATSGKYSDLNNTPDLGVYIKKDGTIGTVPDDTVPTGTKGIRISSDGLLQASNAIIYGTIYASAGTIGGFNIVTTQNDALHAYANTLYVQTTDSNGNTYQAGIRGNSTTNDPSNAAFYVRKKANGISSWANATYPFVVKKNGNTYCENLNIGISLYMCRKDYDFSKDETSTGEKQKVMEFDINYDSLMVGIIKNNTNTPLISFMDDKIELQKDSKYLWFREGSLFTPSNNVDLGQSNFHFKTLYVDNIVLGSEKSISKWGSSSGTTPSGLVANTIRIGSDDHGDKPPGGGTDYVVYSPSAWNVKSKSGSSLDYLPITCSSIGAASSDHNHDSVYAKISHTHGISDINWTTTLGYQGFGHNHTTIYDGQGLKAIAIAGYSSSDSNSKNYLGLIPYDAKYNSVNNISLTRGGTMYLGAAYYSNKLTAYPFECGYFKDIKVYKGSGSTSDISNYATPSGGSGITGGLTIQLNGSTKISSWKGTSNETINITASSIGAPTYSLANASTYGVMCLYSGTGNYTDGTMTQKAITEAINNASGGGGSSTPSEAVASDGTVRPIVTSGTANNNTYTAWIGTYYESSSYILKVNGRWSSSSYATHGFKSDYSDIRLKTNISDSNKSALNVINSIKIRQFDWIRGGKHQDIGFIADELEQLDKHFAFGGGYEEDGSMNIKSVDSFYLQGYEVKAIQELSQENQKLKNIIFSLQGEISIIKQKLEELSC